MEIYYYHIILHKFYLGCAEWGNTSKAITVVNYIDISQTADEVHNRKDFTIITLNL